MGVLFLYLNLFFLFSPVCLPQNSIGHLDSDWVGGWMDGWMDGKVDKWIDTCRKMLS